MGKKWAKPLYEFVLPSRKITVNVTRSCPNFVDPTAGISDVVSELRKTGKLRVLDFGAGKLRNALYMLSRKAGFRVWAVEFKECFNTRAGKEKLAEARRYKTFFLKKWPDEFLASRFTVDAVLLVNVANVVPQEADRRRIVRECGRRLKKGGWFLWMSQYGEPGYKPGVTSRLQAPDGGWFYRLSQQYQTYYREFVIPEIQTYFPKRSYTLVRQVSSPHHRAFVYEKR
ncbi:MAG TPA: class I SAM-dependent methyltransferase [Candidatus Eisenbacteria bacterium]|nr:class I SAM-dependent methyltransferase [Candidatus Eisenbacteria bacterium]